MLLISSKILSDPFQVHSNLINFIAILFSIDVEKIFVLQFLIGRAQQSIKTFLIERNQSNFAIRVCLIKIFDFVNKNLKSLFHFRNKFFNVNLLFQYIYFAIVTSAFIFFTSKSIFY